jgi:hypothetical protein
VRRERKWFSTTETAWNCHDLNENLEKTQRRKWKVFGQFLECRRKLKVRRFSNSTCLRLWQRRRDAALFTCRISPLGKHRGERVRATGAGCYFRSWYSQGYRRSGHASATNRVTNRMENRDCSLLKKGWGLTRRSATRVSSKSHNISLNIFTEVTKYTATSGCAERDETYPRLQ